jgi:hypothetical protein
MMLEHSFTGTRSGHSAKLSQDQKNNVFISRVYVVVHSFHKALKM